MCDAVGKVCSQEHTSCPFSVKPLLALSSTPPTSVPVAMAASEQSVACVTVGEAAAMSDTLSESRLP